MYVRCTACRICSYHFSRSFLAPACNRANATQKLRKSERAGGRKGGRKGEGEGEGGKGAAPACTAALPLVGARHSSRARVMDIPPG